MTEQLNKDRIEKSVATLTTMFDYLGLKANVKVNEVDSTIGLTIESEDAGRIIGRKGQTLQSLELLLNRIITKNDIECPWLTINVDGYSSSSHRRISRGTRSDSRDDRYERIQERHTHKRENYKSRNSEDRFGVSDDRNISEDSLQKMALDAAKEVKRWGEPVQLKPMPPHDRRVVHLALKEDGEIKTESLSVEGSDTLKSVVISLNQQEPHI